MCLLGREGFVQEDVGHAKGFLQAKWRSVPQLYHQYLSPLNNAEESMYTHYITKHTARNISDISVTLCCSCRVRTRFSFGSKLQKSKHPIDDSKVEMLCSLHTHLCRCLWSNLPPTHGRASISSLPPHRYCCWAGTKIVFDSCCFVSSLMSAVQVLNLVCALGSWHLEKIPAQPGCPCLEQTLGRCSPKRDKYALTFNDVGGKVRKWKGFSLHVLQASTLNCC